MALKDLPDWDTKDKIEKVVIIDEYIEKSDDVESDIQFKLNMLSDYRTKLMDERTKELA